MLWQRNKIERWFRESEKAISTATELLAIYRESEFGSLDSMIEFVRRMYSHFFKAFESMIKIIGIYSPKTANSFNEMLNGFKEKTAEALNRDYRKPLGTIGLTNRHSEEVAIRNARAVFNVQIDFLLIFYNFIEKTFDTIEETMKRTRGKPPIEHNEYIYFKLKEVDESYAKMYLGAWEAFESKNPERYRHVSTSTREIIRRLLGEKSEDRKKRIMEVSGSKTTTEFITSLAKAIDKLHDTLSKGVHREIDRETALLTIRITEAIIEYLYEKREL